MPRTTPGPGDPDALIDLLWAPSTKVGRSGATVASVVEAAIEIADADGIEALTMRGLADRVGVGAMTLYGYVPGKAELLELMVDRVVGSTYDRHPLPGALGGWRAGLEHMSARVYSHGVAHGWALDVEPARPILGPGVCLVYEAELAAVDGIGLSDLEMDHVVTTVRSSAQAAARWQVALSAVRASSGLTDAQWWARYGPRLAHAMAGTSLPIAARVGESISSAGEPWASLQLGLGLLLDGLERRLGR